MKQLILGFSLLIVSGCSESETRQDNLDTTFDPGTGVDDHISSTINYLAVQSDDKIVIGGNFVSFNRVNLNTMARLNSNGSIDHSFDVGAGFIWTPVALEIQPDGKIVVGGAGGSAPNYLTRLNTNGTHDPNFYSGTGFNYSVYSLAIQPDGKIIVGGEFTFFNGNPRNFIARLNSDGTLDESFNQGSGFNERVLSTILQPDGKILVGGYFTTFDGVECNHIARLNSDGSMDESFNIGSGFNNHVFCMALQSDGSIIAGGKFSVYNGLNKAKIARLTNSGNLDESFNPVDASPWQIITVAIQNDGKVIVGGMFDPNVQSKDIARLNSDGTLDENYKIGKGFDNTVYYIKLQDDGKLIAVGGFTKFNGTNRSGIARLHE